MDAQGRVFLNREELDLPALQARIIELRTTDPDLNVTIRGDAHSPYKRIRDTLDILQQCNLGKVKLATEVQPNR